MSDLHRAVEAEINAFRPHLTPPLSAIKGRKRARDRRRYTASGVALSVIAVAGVAVGSSTLAGQPDRVSSYAGPTGQQADQQIAEQFNITYTDSSAYNLERDKPLIERCFALPGASDSNARYSMPPQYTITVTGEREIDAFRECLAGINNVNVTASAAAPQNHYTVKPSVRLVLNPNLETERDACFAMPGVHASGQGLANPISYVVTAEAGDLSEAFEACIRNVVDLYVPELSDDVAFINRCVSGERQDLAPEYVGRSEQVLTTARFVVPARVVGRDGECLGRTRDLQLDRLNFIIRDGIIIWAGRF